MAKSLRSKWKRKMRAVKRERYGEKELTRLNDMLMKAGDIQFQSEIKEEKTEDENEMIVDGKEPVQPQPTTKAPASASRPRRSRFEQSEKQSAVEIDLTLEKQEGVEKMTVVGERVFRKSTMRDQYGNYPAWMNKRKVRTQQKKNNRLKRRAKSLKRK